MNVPLELWNIVMGYCEIKTKVNLRHTNKYFIGKLNLNDSTLQELQILASHYLIKQNVSYDDIIKYLIKQNSISNIASYMPKKPNDCVHILFSLPYPFPSTKSYLSCKLCGIQYECEHCFSKYTQSQKLLHTSKNYKYIQSNCAFNRHKFMEYRQELLLNPPIPNTITNNNFNFNRIITPNIVDAVGQSINLVQKLFKIDSNHTKLGLHELSSTSDDLSDDLF